MSAANCTESVYKKSTTERVTKKKPPRAAENCTRSTHKKSTAKRVTKKFATKSCCKLHKERVEEVHQRGSYLPL